MFGSSKTIAKIKEEIKQAGTKTMLMFELVQETLMKGDTRHCKKVVEDLEPELDQLENKIEKHCIRYLALYSPKAKSLRTIIMYLKINCNLERIGDLCCGIALSLEKIFAEEKNVKYENFNLKQLFTQLLENIIKTNKCIHNEDVFEAMEVINKDKEINQSYYDATKKVMEELKKESHQNEVIYELLKILQRLERIGDQCKNIAEEMIYLAEGKVVRH